MNKRNKLGLLLVAIAALSLSGCIVRSTAEKDRETRNLAVKDFERIDISGSFDVVYEQGTEYKVVAEGSKRQLDALDVKSEGGTLSLAMKMMRLDVFRGGIKITVSSPDLVGVTLTGNGDFEASGHVDTDEMWVRLTGNGDIDFYDLICDHLYVDLTGNGDVNVKNLVAGSTTLKLTGNGDIEVEGRTKKFDMQKRGNGDIDVSDLKIME